MEDLPSTNQGLEISLQANDHFPVLAQEFPDSFEISLPIEQLPELDDDDDCDRDRGRYQTDLLLVAR